MMFNRGTACHHGPGTNSGRRSYEGGRYDTRTILENRARGDPHAGAAFLARRFSRRPESKPAGKENRPGLRSEEHTSELPSQLHLACRLLLLKKKHDNIPTRQTML